MYIRSDKIDKPEVKQVHLWCGERIDKETLSVVDVTVCGWVNPPHRTGVLQQRISNL